MTGTPTTTMVPEGRTEADGLFADIVTITPEFFTALRIPLRLGRGITDRDRAGSAPVVVVNEAAAKQFWPGGASPIGRRVVMRDWGEPYQAEVVGVVGDVRQMGMDVDARPAAYYPVAQFPETLLRQAMVIRTAGPAERTIAAAREQVWAVDRDQPVASAGLLSDVVAAAVAQRRFNFILAAAFAAAAMLLAGLGVYGVVAFGVGQRTREIGVRVALGARPADVARFAVRLGTVPVAAGAAAGLAGALAASRALEGLLFGVRPADVPTLAGVAALVLLLGAAACYAPTRRALRVDAAEALRQE
jgi:putative ABC transport system permease protein